MPSSLPSRLARCVLLAFFVYACWLGMMALHELGHVLHAWASGGSVERVVVPLLGFSRTDLAHNPRPLFVAWGGAIWGVLLPMGILALARASRLTASGHPGLLFFAGFCLVANGAYLGFGVWAAGGDARDLVRYGTPCWVLVLFGTATMAAGLALWHRLGSRLGLRRSANRG